MYANYLICKKLITTKHNILLNKNLKINKFIKHYKNTFRKIILFFIYFLEKM
jgi:hypothetical protein